MPEVDYILALTRIDEVNLVASQIASKMGAKHVICRLRNTEYIHKDAVVSPKDFNISYVTYPEMAAKNDIEHMFIRSQRFNRPDWRSERMLCSVWVTFDCNFVLLYN